MDIHMDKVDERIKWLVPEPKQNLRVGVKYQAKIPDIMEDYEPSPHIFDLSIPISWVHEEVLSKSVEGKVDILLPVPGSLDESWSDLERDGFVLGFYFFGKNLRALNRFMDNKGKGTIMCYYYGTFHRSEEYFRWSKWRKSGGDGKKILSDWRLHEFLSRISSDLTDECKNSLKSVSEVYTKRKLSFEEFVLTMKRMVGMSLLVEGVAIGKGKLDLAKYHDVPNYKPSLLLTMPEVLDVLHGNVRLSKARSSDLFEGAVWPRLSAKGWHSVPQNSMNCLVFIVPGVAEFSRRNLEKGVHYFDSILDVLGKVASEPELLGLELDPDTNQDSDDKEPDGSNQYSECFTIVDTSLVCKNREVVKTVFITEQESDEQDVTKSNHDVFGSPENEEIVEENNSEGVLIDLNLTQVGPSSDSDEASKQTAKEPGCTSPGAAMVNQPPRHSTRNRPLTMKALEAFACGFLSPNKKRKGAEEKPAGLVLRGKTSLGSIRGVDGVFDGSNHMVCESPN